MAPASSAAVGLAMPRPAMSFATCRAPYPYSRPRHDMQQVAFFGRAATHTSHTLRKLAPMECLETGWRSLTRVCLAMRNAPCLPTQNIIRIA